MKNKTSLLDAMAISGLLVAAFVVLNVLSAVLWLADRIIAHGGEAS